ncbi:MAG: hypothetical protein ACQERX_06395 [Bacillota bacterium]
MIKKAYDIYIDVKKNIEIHNNFQQTLSELKEVENKKFICLDNINKELDKVSKMFDEAIKKSQCNPNVADWIMKELENTLTSNSSSDKSELFNKD